MQVGWGRPPPRVVHVVGRRGGGVLCVFALWCMGTLALASSRWRRRRKRRGSEGRGRGDGRGGGALAYTQITIGALENAG